MDAAEIEITGRDTGRITSASGYGSHGEPVRRLRSKSGAITGVWLAGINARSERAVATEIERKYAPRKRRAR
jgi:hypothetical protein